MTNLRTYLNQLPPASGADSNDILWLSITDGMGGYVDRYITFADLADSLFAATTLTPGRAVITDGAGAIIVSTVTSTEIGYLSGATSNIQAQINAISTNVMTWNEVTGTSQSMAVNNAYVANNAGLVTLTLPATAVLGDRVKIVGKGAGGWRIAQNSGQVIHFGNQDTTSGVGGRLDSTNRYDNVELVCITANTDWAIISSIGNIGVV